MEAIQKGNTERGRTERLDMTFDTESKELITDAYNEATAKHSPLRSLHEGYAVLFEEVEELWDEIKKQSDEREIDTLIKEAAQVGAMAQRILADLLLPMKEVENLLAPPKENEEMVF